MSSSWYSYACRLAAGGMAEVLLASQQGLAGFEKLVVMKRILPHLRQDRAFRQMFLDEARLAASLKHPNIVEIYDVGREGEDYYFVMEYLSGEDMRYLLRAVRKAGAFLPVPIVCHVMAGVAAALSCAHSATDHEGKLRQIVHRDVSPSNIMVTWDGVTKVVDFGIASANDQNIYTPRDTLKGKLAYMSPEHVLQEELGPQSDLFSLGVVFYELLTSQRLFSGTSEVSIVQSIMEEEPHPPSSINPAVPEELDRLVLRLLGKKPTDRTHSAAAVQEQLDGVIAQVGNITPYQLGKWLSDSFPKRREARTSLEREVTSRGRTQQPALSELPGLPFSEDSAVNSRLLPARAAGDQAPYQSSPNTGMATPSMPLPAGTHREGMSWKWALAGISLLTVLAAGFFMVGQQNADLPSGVARAPEPVPPTASGSVDKPLAVALNQPAAEPDLTATPDERNERGRPAGAAEPPVVVVPSSDRGSRPARQPSSQLASVTITFDANKATVDLDGKRRVGSSPLEFLGLSRGQYVVKIQADGYASTRRSVRLRSGQELTINMPLGKRSADKAKLSIRSSPSGARILIDGKSRGTTPTTGIVLEPGRNYTVTLEHKGRQTWRSMVTLAAGTVRTIQAELVNTPAVAVAPAGADLVAAADSPRKRTRDVRVRTSTMGEPGPGRTLFAKCTSCHGAQAPALTPAYFTRKQWIRYLASSRHGRHDPLAPYVNGDQLADIKAYLVQQAADSGGATAAGVR